MLPHTAADVHWLNSLDGEACLLVDSYDDLRDGIALEEAVALIEVGGLKIAVGLRPHAAVPYRTLQCDVCGRITETIERPSCGVSCRG